MRLRRQMIVLDVPIQREEELPENWDWGTLLDTSEEVLVMGRGEVYWVDVED